jgi:hypothetical protein
MYFGAENGSDNTLGVRALLNNSGQFIAYGDMRAPIFYDSANTSFYVDPASASNLNTLTLNGSSVFQSNWTTRFQSGSDFVDGTLVSTDIPATASNGDSFIIEITGKSYDGSNPPFKAVAQGYLYNDTIISFSGINYGGSFSSYIRVFQDGGVLKFWWPRISYWNSFNVNVMGMDAPSNSTITRNRVTSITNSTEPTGTKKVTITLNQALRENAWINNKYFGSDGAIYSTILYDTNNTGYYLDPASTGTSLITAGGVYAAGQVRAAGWWGSPSASATGLAVEIGESAGRCFVLSYDRDATNYGPISFEATDFTFTGIVGGFIGINTSVRAPIFYDTNDTAYYLDPASNGTRAGFINGNLWINPKSESYGEGVVFNMPSQGTWGGLRWYRNGSAGSFAGNWAFGYFGNETNNDIGFHNGTNGWRLDHSFNMTVNGSVRAPIFYDSNNTGYYVDAASTSNLNGLTVASTITGSITGSAAFVAGTNLGKTGGQGFFTTASWTAADWANLPIGGGGMTIWNTPGQPAGNNYGFFIKTGNRDAGNGWGGIWQDYNGGSLYYGATTEGSAFATWRKTVAYGVNSGGTLFAETFYDSNNTAYYIDPASSVALSAAGSVILAVGGDRYVQIGSSTNYYYQLKSVGDNFQILEAGTTPRLTISYPSGAVTAATDFRAPIFYDSNNTSYYLDPTSLYSLRTVGDWRSNSDSWTGEFAGKIQYHDNHWYFQASSGWKFRNAGGSDVVVINSNGFATFSDGISINSGDGFSSLYMSDSDEGERVIHCNSNRIGFLNQSGGWGSYCADNGDWVTDTIGWAGTSSRAPIFYDSNDTAYYVDPNGTTILNVVAGANRIYTGYDSGSTNSVSCSNWFRSSGASGWFNGSYGGGIWQEDSTYVKVYNSKAFYVPNNIDATGNVTAYYSDERLKIRTGLIENAIDKVKTLDGFYYVENETAKELGYNNDSQQVGLSAQQVQAILPEAIHMAPVDIAVDENGNKYSKTGENYLTVDYSRLVPLLIEAIKEQQEQINQLKLALNQLKGE